MSIKDTNTPTAQPVVPAQRAATSTRQQPAEADQRPTRYRVLAVLRITMGLTFFWAFLDKAFGLGYATGPKQAWINGGSPTKGFLSHVEVGPFQSMLRDMAGTGWADWLFMLAVFSVGIALLLGIGMRVAATAGTLLLTMMWVSEWPPARFDTTGAATSSANPLIDEHVAFIVVVIVLASFAAGDTWGLGRRWASLNVVRRNPWLR